MSTSLTFFLVLCAFGWFLVALVSCACSLGFLVGAPVSYALCLPIPAGLVGPDWGAGDGV